MYRATTFTGRPPARARSMVKVYAPFASAIPPTPRSGMPTLAPPSGWPAADETLPEKTAVCACAVPVRRTTARATVNTDTALRIGRKDAPPMTDLARVRDETINDCRYAGTP